LTLCVFHLFFCRSSLICPFSLFWLGYTHFFFAITFSCDLGMSLSVWVSWALSPFWLSHDFLIIFLSLKFSPASSMGCDPSWDFSWKKIYSGSKRITRDIFILKCERDNKDGIFSFQTQAIKINKLWSRLVWWFGLCKEMHFMSLWTTNPLHTIMHTFKTPSLRVMAWGWLFIFLFIYFGL
jgi:hypothetical protein